MMDEADMAWQETTREVQREEMRPGMRVLRDDDQRKALPSAQARFMPLRGGRLIFIYT